MRLATVEIEVLSVSTKGVRLATVEVLAVAFILKRGANAFPTGFIWQDLFGNFWRHRHLARFVHIRTPF